MHQPSSLLPAMIGRALSLLPRYPGSLLFALALNAWSRDALPPNLRQSLLGKHVQIRVTDAALAFDFTVAREGFVPRRSADNPDLTISASAKDFLLLMRRKEDPDTLFFGRRLSIEGNTELGLALKNFLDSLEVPALLRKLGKLNPFRTRGPRGPR
jgi:predicted lipid carrier protein YhbT